MSDVAREASWLEQTAGVRVLDDRRVLAVRGDDARTWLNGQVTNDLRALHEGDAIYALVLTVRGKVIADAFVLDRGEAGLALVVPARAVDELRAHFDKYIIMEDVTVAPEDDVVVTVQGPRAGEVVDNLRASQVGFAGFPCPRLGAVGVDLLFSPGPNVAGVVVAAAQAVGGGAVSADGWELAAARCGVPEFGRDFDDRRYPQEAGLRERAVSFTKGCYLGQEVVCTLENKGQLVRKLVQLSLAAGDRPTASAAVESEDGTAIGDVTSAVTDAERGRTLAFAYVKRASAVAGTRVRAGGRPATIERVMAGDG